jgi:GH43 family beta-xylosidase
MKILLMSALLVASTILIQCKTQTAFVYQNPLVEQRADPMIVRAHDGMYYFIGTTPAYDCIELRKSKTINGLKSAQPVVVWNKHESGPMSMNIWAPELHRIDEKWYIYFAAAPQGHFMGLRMFALSNISEDPTTGNWIEEGQISTERNGFALDATTFEHNRERYLVWAEIIDGAIGSALVLSKMENATKLIGPQTIISVPTYDWECQTYKVNEGPAVIKRNGKIFLTYSASATDHTYAMGLLWADENADLTLAESWNKMPVPIFYTHEDFERFGPGHNQFTIAEDGKTDLMVYHARNYKDIEGHSLGDPNRHARVRVLHWLANGFPDFRQDTND